MKFPAIDRKHRIILILAALAAFQLVSAVLLPRGLLPRLNGRSGREYDAAPAELRPTIMAVAKLEHRLREKRP